MVLQPEKFVDKYLLIIMIFMFVTIPIAFVSPATGEIRDPPIIPLFYGAIAGIIIIFFYNGYKERQKHQKERKERRSKK